MQHKDRLRAWLTLNYPEVLDDCDDDIRPVPFVYDNDYKDKRTSFTERLETLAELLNIYDNGIEASDTKEAVIYIQNEETHVEETITLEPMPQDEILKYPAVDCEGYKYLEDISNNPFFHEFANECLKDGGRMMLLESINDWYICAESKSFGLICLDSEYVLEMLDKYQTLEHFQDDPLNPPGLVPNDYIICDKSDNVLIFNEAVELQTDVDNTSDLSIEIPDLAVEEHRYEEQPLELA